MQCVQVKNIISEWHKNFAGIAQAFIPAPYFFLVYVNDLPMSGNSLKRNFKLMILF